MKIAPATQNFSDQSHLKSSWEFRNRNSLLRGAWLAWLGEHVTLDIQVMSSSPTLGIEIIFKKSKL